MQIYSIVLLALTTLLASVSNVSLARSTTMSALNYSAEVRPVAGDQNNKRLLTSNKTAIDEERTPSVPNSIKSGLYTIGFKARDFASPNNKRLESFLTSHGIQSAATLFQEENVHALKRLVELFPDQDKSLFRSLRKFSGDEDTAAALIRAGMSKDSDMQIVGQRLITAQLEYWEKTDKSFEEVTKILNFADTADDALSTFVPKATVLGKYIKQKSGQLDDEHFFRLLIHFTGKKDRSLHENKASFYQLMAKQERESELEKQLFKTFKNRQNPMRLFFTEGHLDKMGIKVLQSPTLDMLERLYFTVEGISKAPSIETKVKALRASFDNDRNFDKLLKKGQASDIEAVRKQTVDLGKEYIQQGLAEIASRQPHHG